VRRPTVKERVEAIHAKEKERREKLREKRIAALDDTDYHVLALIGVGSPVLQRRQTATVMGRPIWAWHIEGVSVERSIRRLRVLRYITTNCNEKLELRRK
jgi:hypothetical protein